MGGLIGVKYCGGCNPFIDRGLVVRRAGEILKQHGYKLEFFDLKDCRAVVVVNGCTVGCAEAPSDKSIIRVCGTELERENMSEDRLPMEIAKRVMAAVDKQCFQARDGIDDEQVSDFKGG